MSDEPDKPETRRVAWAAPAILFAALLSCCGLFAFIWLNGRPSWTVILLWAIGTAIGWRLGMRALK
jgi:fatty acid desaturase